MNARRGKSASEGVLVRTAERDDRLRNEAVDGFGR